MYLDSLFIFNSFINRTKIHTKNGLKNIENIRVGDFVWAWDEEFDRKALKKVVSTKKSKTDVIIELHTIEGEIIKTTPTHPPASARSMSLS